MKSCSLLWTSSALVQGTFEHPELWEPLAIKRCLNTVLSRLPWIAYVFIVVHSLLCNYYMTEFFLCGKIVMTWFHIDAIIHGEIFMSLSKAEKEYYFELLGGNKTIWYHTVWFSLCFLCSTAQNPAAVSNFLPPCSRSLMGRQRGKKKPLVMISLLGEQGRALSFEYNEVMTVQNLFPTCGKKRYQVNFWGDSASPTQLHTFSDCKLCWSSQMQMERDCLSQILWREILP